MIGGKVGNLALFLAQLAHNESRLKHAAQKRAEEEAQRAVDEMQARVPEQSGTARESIRWEPRPEGGARVLAGGPETTKADYDYIRALEYGRAPTGSEDSHGQRPQPFFRPVEEETRRHGADRIGRGLADDMKD